MSCVPQLTPGRFELTMPDDGMSDDGICAIKIWLRANVHCSPLPANWRWVARVGGKGEYVGTFTKRVAKFYARQHGIKVSSNLLGALGSLVSQYCRPADEPYYYDIVTLDSAERWIGQFGDSGSCFSRGGCHQAAPRDMHAAGCLAVRFYHDSSYHAIQGYARAWLRPMSTYVVLFNAYGLTSLQQARVLSAHLGCSYASCSVSNYDNETVFCNARAQLLGPAHLLFAGSKIDLKIPSIGTKCYECGCIVLPGHGLRDPDGNTLCQDCFSEHWTECYECSDVIHIEEARTAECSDHAFCEACFSEIFSYCEHCEKDWLSGDVAESPDGRLLCSSCFSDLFCDCQNCGASTANKDLREAPDNSILCEDCFASLVRECVECSAEIIATDEGYCQECADRRAGELVQNEV